MRLRWDVWMASACLLVALAFVLLTIALVVSGGAFIDTDHMVDTLFILGGAWRAYQGLTPSIDFGSFYGGFLEQFIAACMHIFGVGFGSFYASLIALASVLSVCAVVALRDRLSFLGIGVVIMTTTCLMLTRQPLEYDAAVRTIVSTHSFIYNRFGLACLLIGGLYVSLERDGRGWEIAGGLCVGLLFALSAYMKPSFIILGFAAVFSLSLQRRWWGICGIILAVSTIMLLVEAPLERFAAAVRYSAFQLAAVPSAQPGYVIMRAFLVPLVQPLATIVALASFGYVLSFRVVRWRLVLSILVMALAGLGMAATMGGEPGQLSLPIIVLLALAAAEWARRHRLGNVPLVQLTALGLAASLALPHLANLSGVLLTSQQRASQMLIRSGPLARYVAIERGLGAPRQVAYVALADGISELKAMGGASRLGIVADRGLSFEYAMGAPAVPNFPLWQRPTSPEFAAGTMFDRRASVVMLGREDVEGWVRTRIRPIVQRMMGNSYRACRRSRYWDIFVRKELASVQCQPGLSSISPPQAS